MNKLLLSILFISITIFSQVYGIRSKTRIEVKKDRIKKHIHVYRSRREEIREQLRRYREERERGEVPTGCCAGVKSEDVVTILKGLAVIGITIAQFIIAVVH